VCDPDDKKYEANALGLFYTAVSRATTLGDTDGLNSAIYFQGRLKGERFRRLINCKDSCKIFEKATKRNEWVYYLKTQEHKCKNYVTRTLERSDEIKLFSQRRFTYEQLYDRFQAYKVALFQYKHML